MKSEPEYPANYPEAHQVMVGADKSIIDPPEPQRCWLNYLRVSLCCLFILLTPFFLVFVGLPICLMELWGRVVVHLEGFFGPVKKHQPSASGF